MTDKEFVDFIHKVIETRDADRFHEEIKCRERDIQDALYIALQAIKFGWCDIERDGKHHVFTVNLNQSPRKDNSSERDKEEEE